MEQRECLNSVDGLRKNISLDEKFIQKDYVKISSLLEDEAIGIQRHKNPNLYIIKRTRLKMVEEYLDLIKAKYSLGVPVNNLLKIIQKV